MNSREWMTGIKLWERAYPDYPNQHSPSVQKLQEWFDRHRECTFVDWANWPEGYNLRVYLSQFFAVPYKERKAQ